MTKNLAKKLDWKNFGRKKLVQKKKLGEKNLAIILAAMPPYTPALLLLKTIQKLLRWKIDECCLDYNKAPIAMITNNIHAYYSSLEIAIYVFVIILKLSQSQFVYYSGIHLFLAVF